MVRKLQLAGVVAAMLVSVAVARAGTGSITGMTSVTFTNDDPINCQTQGWEYHNNYHTLEWYVNGGAGQISLTDNEVFITPDTHTYNLTVNGDPPATLSSLVFNNSGVDWIEYDVTVLSLSPGVTVVFTGTPTSTPAWQDTVVVTPSSIHYSGVTTTTPLLNGGSDTLVYTLNITPPDGYTGSVSFSITSTPTLASGVPEPASLGLLALGGLGLVLRRRGR